MLAKPRREDALELLYKHNETASLRRHGLAVEAVMRYFARMAGEDEEKWGCIGMLHDLDYEKWPEQHCDKTKEIMDEAGWPEDWTRAAISHAWGICNDLEPQLYMEKVLYATDELSGLISAAALMRPSKSIHDLGVASVLKKWKQKSFFCRGRPRLD